MMGQDLFEHPLRQYTLYNITPLKELSALLGRPDAEESVTEESFTGESFTEEQLAAMEDALEAHPDAALTYDEAAALWIVGDEDDINRMFADREDFVAALDNDEDPGV